MAKNLLSKRKKRSGKVSEDKILKVHPNEIEEERFNFGGLPIRDLKKNLGCG